MKGKPVLDVGCGARRKPKFSDYFKEYLYRDYEPWIARCFHEAGAYVFGIDMRAQNNELFAALSINLLDNKGALGFLPSESFDLAICHHLVSLSGDIWSIANAPNLREQAGPSQLLEMRRELLSQLSRILAPGGMLYASADLFDVLFVKRGGMLEKERDRIDCPLYIGL